MVYVDLSGRELHNGDKIIEWEEAPDANVVFARSPNDVRNYKLVRTSDGVYCSCGMLMIIR